MKSRNISNIAVFIGINIHCISGIQYIYLWGEYMLKLRSLRVFRPGKKIEEVEEYANYTNISFTKEIGNKQNKIMHIMIFCFVFASAINAFLINIFFRILQNM